MGERTSSTGSRHAADRTIILELRGGSVLVDSRDWKRINEFHWYVLTRQHYSSYAFAMMQIREGRRKQPVPMHRFIMGFPPAGYHVDHINGNGLDNRRINLRVVTSAVNQVNRHSLNANNKSGVRGVHWHAITRKWRAEIKVNRKAIHLGLFSTVEDAAQARLEAEIRYYGGPCPTALASNDCSEAVR